MNHCFRVFVRWFAGILLASPFYTPASAADLKFISIEVAPWAYIDASSGEYIGIFPDIIKSLEEKTNYNIDITITPFTFGRIDRELMIGRQDCTIVIQSKEREEFVVTGETFFKHAMGVVPVKAIPLGNYSDLYGLRISTHKKLRITDQFFEDQELNKAYDPNYEIGLRKIKYGRIDAVAGAIPTIQYLAKKNFVDDLLGEPLVLKREPVSLQCSKKSKKLDLMADINQAIKDMKTDGTLSAIFGKNR